MRDSCSAAVEVAAAPAAAAAGTVAAAPGGRVAGEVEEPAGEDGVPGAPAPPVLTSRSDAGSGFFCWEACDEIEERIVGASSFDFSGGDEVIFFDIATAPFLDIRGDPIRSTQTALIRRHGLSRKATLCLIHVPLSLSLLRLSGIFYATTPVLR